MSRPRRSLGHADLVAPPTFAVVVTRGPQIAVIDDPDLGLDFSRVVHGDQKFQFARPIVAGDVLHTTASVASARTMAGNDILTIRSDVADADGNAVVSRLRDAGGTSGGGLTMAVSRSR